jgi:hypothetical protein
MSDCRCELRTYYTHVSVGVFTRTPFFLVDSTFLRIQYLHPPDAWPYFPGLKVGNIYLRLFFLFDYLVA